MPYIMCEPIVDHFKSACFTHCLTRWWNVNLIRWWREQSAWTWSSRCWKMHLPGSGCSWISQKFLGGNNFFKRLISLGYTLCKIMGMKLWIMVGTLQVVHSTSTSSLAIPSPWRGGGETFNSPPPNQNSVGNMWFLGLWHSLLIAWEARRVTRGFWSLLILLHLPTLAFVNSTPPPNTCNC